MILIYDIYAQNQATDFNQVLLAISTKGCNINPCGSEPDNVFLSQDLLYSGAYTPKPLPSPPGDLGQNFVSPFSSSEIRK